MKLYKVPRDTRIRVMEFLPAPPGGIEAEVGDVLMYHHVDGMFSYCTNKDGKTVYLRAAAEVEIVGDDNK